MRVKRTASDYSVSNPLLTTSRYHNYMQYLSNWTDHIARGTGSNDLSKRPVPVAMLYDNTTSRSSFPRILSPFERSKGIKPCLASIRSRSMPHASIRWLQEEVLIQNSHSPGALDPRTKHDRDLSAVQYQQL